MLYYNICQLFLSAGFCQIFSKTYLFFFPELSHWANSVSKSQCPSVCLSVCPFVWTLFFLVFLNVLLFPFTKVESAIDQSQRDSLGNSYKKTLISDLTILAQKWLKIVTQILFFFQFLGLSLVHGRSASTLN